MAEYKSYINALKQCAKEHEKDNIPFANIRTTDLCNDTADLLEKLEIGVNKAIEQITNSMNEHLASDGTPIDEYAYCYLNALEILEENIGE